MHDLVRDQGSDTRRALLVLELVTAGNGTRFANLLN
jgi:hypothetical protein